MTRLRAGCSTCRPYALRDPGRLLLGEGLLFEVVEKRFPVTVEGSFHDEGQPVAGDVEDFGAACPVHCTATAAGRNTAWWVPS